MSDRDSPSLEELLSHREWVNRLAKSLVRDRNDAADLVQDTLLEALVSPPRQGEWRPWLATVVRNHARKKKRSSRRREEREQFSARSIVDDSDPLAIAQQACSHRQVARLVLELPEPYRTTMLCRYFQDQTPTQIAAAKSVSVETVHTRLKRGRSLLRSKLRRERRLLAWLIASAMTPKSGPLSRVRSSTENRRRGRLARPHPKTWLVVPLTAALLLILGSAGWQKSSTPPSHGFAGEIQVAEAPLGSVRVAFPEPVSRQRQSAPSVESGTPEPDGARHFSAHCLADPGPLRGTILHPGGRPVVGARVLLLKSSWLTRDLSAVLAILQAPSSGGLPDEWQLVETEADGAFHFSSPPSANAWDLLACHWQHGYGVRAGISRATANLPCDITLTPGNILWGCVKDPTGKPLSGALVSILPLGSEAPFTSPHEIEAEPSGEFRSLPLPHDRFLVQVCAPFHFFQERVVEFPLGRRQIRQDWELPPAPTWEGQFVDVHGNPAQLHEGLPWQGNAVARDQLRLVLSEQEPRGDVDFAGTPFTVIPASSETGTPSGRVFLEESRFVVQPDGPACRFVSLWWNDQVLGVCDWADDSKIVVDLTKISPPPQKAALPVRVIDEAGQPVPRFEAWIWTPDERDTGIFSGQHSFLAKNGFSDSHQQFVDPRSVLWLPGKPGQRRGESQGPFLCKGNANGILSIPGVTPGRCRIRVAQGHSVAIRWTRVTTVMDPVTLVLPTSDGRLDVWVESSQGTVPEQTAVTLLDEKGEFWFLSGQRTYLDDRGFCSFRVPEGRYWVVLTPEDGIHGSVAHQALAQPVGRVHLELPIGEPLCASVPDMPLGPFQYVLRDHQGVNVIDDRREGIRRLSKSSPTFFVAPGSYTLEIHGLDRRTKSVHRTPRRSLPSRPP